MIVHLPLKKNMMKTEKLYVLNAIKHVKLAIIQVWQEFIDVLNAKKGINLVKDFMEYVMKFVQMNSFFIMVIIIEKKNVLIVVLKKCLLLLKVTMKMKII